MAEVWLKPNPNRSDIAWVSFDLQEHKSHNNAALVMDHLSLLWSNYQEYGILTQYLFYPHMWGENVRKRNYQCSLRTLVISLPKGVPWERRLMVTCRGPETLSLCWLWAILGPCESGISPNPRGSLSLPVLLASTPLELLIFSKPISHFKPLCSAFSSSFASSLSCIFCSKRWSCFLSYFPSHCDIPSPQISSSPSWLLLNQCINGFQFCCNFMT